MSRTLTTLLAACLILMACQKNTSEQITPTPPAPVDTAAIVNANVKVVDSTKLRLNTDTTKTNQGIYEFTITGTAPDYKVNDIIVGASGDGYMRRISSVDIAGTKVVYQTTPVSLEDVFTKGSFSVGMRMSSMARSMGPNVYDLSGTVLFQEGPITLSVDKGEIGMDGDWDFDYSITSSRTQKVKFACPNLVVTAYGDIKLAFDEKVAFHSKSGTIGQPISYRTIAWIGIVPLTIVIKLQFKYNLDFQISSQMSQNVVVNAKNTSNIGVYYENKTWTPVFENKFTGSVSCPPGDLGSGVSMNLKLTPEIIVTIAGVVGPYASSGLVQETYATFNGVKPASIFSTKAWLQTKLGMQATLFGWSLVNMYKEWNTDPLLFQTPYTVAKTDTGSGDNQTAPPNEYLPKPIRVKVTDNFNKTWNNMFVYFKATEGGGSVNTLEPIKTNDKGEASVLWKMGATANTAQKATATIIDTRGNVISTVEFNAKSDKIDTLALLRSKTWTLTNASSAPGYQQGEVSCPQPNMYALITYLKSGQLSFVARNGGTQFTESKTALRKKSNFTLENGVCVEHPTYENLSESASGMLILNPNQTLGYGTFPGETPAPGGTIEWLGYDSKILAISSTQLVLQSITWGKLIFE